MNRSELIDYIDDIYNTVDDYEAIEDIIVDVLDLDDIDQLSDDDPDEGMFAEVSTSDLLEIKRRIDESRSSDQTTFDIALTAKELSILRDAMEDYSNPAFTKDREMSRVAKGILNKLNEYR